MSGPNLDLFWAKVDKSGDCWIWTAFLDRDGYGMWGWREDGKWHNVRAHRFAYEQLVGPIPAGLVIDHLCRNPSCQNPDHLEPVTVRENTLRGEGPTAKQARQTHCLKGHEFTEANTYLRKGSRVCRACMCEAQKIYIRRLKERQAA